MKQQAGETLTGLRTRETVRTKLASIAKVASKDKGCVAKKLIWYNQVKTIKRGRMKNINFKWKHYQPEIITLCCRWYLKYPISYRNLEEMMEERNDGRKKCRS